MFFETIAKFDTFQFICGTPIIHASRFTSFLHFKSVNFESANTLSKCESKATELPKIALFLDFKSTMWSMHHCKVRETAANTYIIY